MAEACEADGQCRQRCFQGIQQLVLHGTSPSVLKLTSGISMYRHCAADHCSDKTSEVQVGFAIIKRIEWHLASIQRLLKAFSTPSY
jgi:hypothetical protein